MLREIDKKLLEDVAVLTQAAKEGRQVFLLKKRRCGMTYMMQLLETEDIGDAEVIKENFMNRALTNFHQMGMSINLATPERWQEFKNWVEETPLFRAIKKHAGTGLIIESLPEGFQLQLNGINKIDKAEDLPIELIQNFYINSPFYINNQEKQNLNNENTSEENLW